MANEIKLKPSFTDNNYRIIKEAITPTIYEETQWHTGDVITQEKMMKIEEWLRSSANELLVARRGKTISGNDNIWNNIKERFDYLTNSLRIITPEGSESIIEKIEDAIAGADDAAESIENMTVDAETLPAGEQARIINWEKIDEHWALTLGLPLARPIEIEKTYSSVAELQANIYSDLPVGSYAIVASGASDQDNGRLYIRTESAPYYSFIADIAAATPTFRIGTVNVLDATGTKSASIDVTDPENPVLNLDLPAVPVFNSNVDVTTVAADQPASASLNGPATAKQLSLSIPCGPTPNLTIGTVTTGIPGSNASASITGTPEDPILNLTIPRGNTGSLENLPIATREILGTVMVGDNLTITPEGVLSAVASTVRSEDVIILTNQWELQNGVYTVIVSSIENINEKTECTVKMDDTYFNLVTSLSVETTDQGTIIFRTNQLPSGSLNITLILQQVR